MEIFDAGKLRKLFRPDWNSSNEDDGSVVIIGGSSLFHGAPILALKAASRIVDMVFFTSPEPSLSAVVSMLKAGLSSFIWAPWEEVDAYIEKSDAVLIGPGMMRFAHESRIMNFDESLKLAYELREKKYDIEGQKTREITKRLLLKFPHKKWVIDAGSLQTMEADWIPDKAIVTPNEKELEMLFGIKIFDSRFKNQELSKVVQEKAKEHKCIIMVKGTETMVASLEEKAIIRGGNPGLTKGGSGDVLAGLTVAILAKNDPFLAACSASYIVKAAADELYTKVGTNYNSNDLADTIPQIHHNLTK